MTLSLQPIADDVLVFALRSAAMVQVVIAVLNLKLAALLRWHGELQRMPLLLRQVFHVHAWFVSAALVIFALLTLRFASDMAAAGSEPLRWMAAGIGLFWMLRVAVQLFYYSPAHWRGRGKETAVHITLLITYSAMAAAYLGAAAGA